MEYIRIAIPKDNSLVPELFRNVGYSLPNELQSIYEKLEAKIDYRKFDYI